MNETVSEKTGRNIEDYAAAMDHILAELNWTSHKQMAQRLKKENLTVAQLAALRTMQQFQRSCSMSELAEAAYQVTPTITGIIDRLERRNLVRREQKLEDRRSYLVSLTPQAIQLLDELDAEKQARLVKIFEDIPENVRQDIIGLMRRYLESVKMDISNIS